MDIAVVRELNRLATENNGLLVPSIVVSAARDVSSPLHSHFTWDDAEAAEAHRVNQARTLIRSVKIEVKTERFNIEAPAYIRDPAAGAAQGYAHVNRLRRDEDAAREAVVAEFSRATAALNRAKAVAAALGITEDIDRLIADILAIPLPDIRAEEVRPARPI